jgi:hypothetical protein
MEIINEQAHFPSPVLKEAALQAESHQSLCGQGVDSALKVKNIHSVSSVSSKDLL